MPRCCSGRRKQLAVNPGPRQMRLSLSVLRDIADAAGVTSVSGLATQARIDARLDRPAIDPGDDVGDRT